MVSKPLLTTSVDTQRQPLVVSQKKMSVLQTIAAAVSSAWSRLTGSKENAKSVVPVIAAPKTELTEPKKTEPKHTEAPKSSITRCFQWIKQGVQSIGSSISKTVSEHPYLLTTALVTAAVYGAYRYGKKIELPKDLDEGVIGDPFVGASAIRDQIMSLEMHDDSMGVALQTHDEDVLFIESTSVPHCYASPQNVSPNTGRTPVWNTSTESMGAAELELGMTENAIGPSLLINDRESVLAKVREDAQSREPTVGFIKSLKEQETAIYKKAAKDLEAARNEARSSVENAQNKAWSKLAEPSTKSKPNEEFNNKGAAHAQEEQRDLFKRQQDRWEKAQKNAADFIAKKEDILHQDGSRALLDGIVDAGKTGQRMIQHNEAVEKLGPQRDSFDLPLGEFGDQFQKNALSELNRHNLAFHAEKAVSDRVVKDLGTIHRAERAAAANNEPRVTGTNLALTYDENAQPSVVSSSGAGVRRGFIGDDSEAIKATRTSTVLKAIAEGAKTAKDVDDREVARYKNGVPATRVTAVGKDTTSKGTLELTYDPHLIDVNQDLGQLARPVTESRKIKVE